MESSAVVTTIPSSTAMKDAAAVSPSTQRCWAVNPCSPIDVLPFWTISSIIWQKNLSEGLHDRGESVLSCLQSDICAAQNLQPVEVCDQVRRKHVRIAVRSERASLLSPHDRVPVGVFK